MTWFVKFKQIVLDRLQKWIVRWDVDVMRTFGEHLEEEMNDPGVENLHDIIAKMDEIRERITGGEHDNYFLWSTAKSYHEQANMSMFIEDIAQTYNKMERDNLK